MKADRHGSVMRDYRRSILLAAKCSAGLLLTATQLQGQPLVVQWYDELYLPDITKAYINPNNGSAEVIYGGGLSTFCSYHETDQYFGPLGEPEPFTGNCYAVGTLSGLLAAPYQLGAGRFQVYHYAPYATPEHPAIVVPGVITITSLTDPPGAESPSTMLPFGPTLYIGGWGLDCAQSPGTVYKVFDASTPWRSCVEHGIRSMELYADTLLAIGYPSVSKLDTADGTVLGTFELFQGTPYNVYWNGKSCLDGDSLYWACMVDGALHVGKFVLGTGPAWEQVLPYAGFPVQLCLDDYDHLWTAAENALIWIDPQTGDFGSMTVGTAITAMDIWPGSMLIGGDLYDGMNFVMRATPSP